MRPIERIPLFLKLIDLDKLAERWWVLPDLLREINCNNKFIKYWLTNPDQRVGQALINCGLVPDSMHIYMDEVQDILLDQGVEPREFLFWTSLFDKEGNRLEESITRLIKDLESDHIKNILKSESLRLDELYRETFENELDIKGSIGLRDSLISLLILQIEELLPESNIIKHSACYRRLKKMYQ